MITRTKLNPFFAGLSDTCFESSGNSNASGTLNGQLKYWKGQKILPDDELIKALKTEITVLDFGNSPLSDVPDERAASLYFRSNLKRRLIGAFMIMRTFQDRWVSQKEIIERFKLSKGFVSQVCNEAVEAGWFIKKVQPRHNMPKVPVYQVSESMKNAAKKYDATKILSILHGGY